MIEKPKRHQTDAIVHNQAKSHVVAGAQVSPFTSENLSVGVTLGTSKGEPVYQFNEDRFRHTLILGKTGSGKSNLVQQMEREDIRSGAGVFILAAHEEDALYPLACVPEERLDDVILIDASNPSYLPCMNPLDIDGDDDAAISKMKSDVFELTNIDCPYEWAGPRYETYLDAALSLMAHAPLPHLHEIAEVKELFTDPDEVRELLFYCRDKRVYNFWTEVFPGATHSSDSGETVDWFLSKLTRFSSDRVLRAVFGRGRRTIDMQEVVREGKILIAYVPEEKIGATAARTLCKWLLMQLRDAILSRAKTQTQGLDLSFYKRSKRAYGADLDPFFVYVDEFGRFATPDFEVLLAEARKQRAGFILSTQTLSQTRVYNRKEQRPASLQEAVLGNVGTIIAYPVGLPDAELLAKQFCVDVDVVKSIKRYRPIARLCVDNQSASPIVLHVDLKPFPDNPDAPELAGERMVKTGVWREKDGEVAHHRSESLEWISEEPTEKTEDVSNKAEDTAESELNAQASKAKESMRLEPITIEELLAEDGIDLKEWEESHKRKKNGLGIGYRFTDYDSGEQMIEDNLNVAEMLGLGEVERVWVIYKDNRIVRPITQEEYQRELKKRIHNQMEQLIPKERFEEIDLLTNPTAILKWFEKNYPIYRMTVYYTIEGLERARVVEDE